MHYYKKNLGDYAKKAGHLSPLEHGVYMLITDAYYANEKAPTLLEATRWARARTDDEKSAVLGVLDEFFSLQENGTYSHSRIEEEISIYQSKAERNREVGKAGGRPPKNPESSKSDLELKPDETEQEASSNPLKTQMVLLENQDENLPGLENNPNHKPLTHNNTPISPNGENDAPKKRKRETISFCTYLKECKENGMEPIPVDDPVFVYAHGSGISDEALELHWNEFRARYTMEGATKYKSWRAVFNKSVRGNWFRLWYFDKQNKCCLTTTGIQAKNLFKTQTMRRMNE